jgi:hypothetical protein
MIRTLVLVLLGMWLTGCTAAYNFKRAEGISQAPTLRRDASVYVSLPKNGWYEDEEGVRSGAQTAQAIATAFSAHLVKVEQAEQVLSTEANLAAAGAGHFVYLVDPLIVHWEDRATEWSGKPDLITIQITIYDVPSKQVLDKVTINGQSKWGTLGGDHPQDLLAKPIDKYVAELFGAQK